MTKEEIINKHASSERRVSDFGQGPAYDWKYMELANARAAMDEYAKQQAIEYDFWKRQNGYTIDASGEWYIKLIVEGDSARTESILVDKVYSQFIEQQNKDNEVVQKGRKNING